MTKLLQEFQRDGYLVLEGFNTDAECDALIRQGDALAKGFSYEGHPSIFQTNGQTRTSDDYFLDSGGRISFFFEKDAFDAEGKLKGELFHSLNKIGHALHDLDPVFDSFTRAPQFMTIK